MREILAPHIGERRLFRATVKSITPTSGRPLVLLNDVLDIQKGLIVTDHVWVRYTDSLRASKVVAGQRIRFTARVSSYVKRDGSPQCGLREVRVDHLPQ